MNYLAFPRTLEKFLKDNTFGWISPSGKLFEVSQYQHLEFFRYYAEADCPEGVKEYFDVARDHKEAAQAEFEKEAGDEHPDWHSFDIFYEFSPEDDLVSRCTAAAYQSGWGRIGTFGGNKMELECFSEHARTLSKHAKGLCALLSRELIMTTSSSKAEPGDGNAPQNTMKPR